MSKDEFSDGMEESSEDKQERLRCNVGRGINNWNCYGDCAFWDGTKCKQFETPGATELKPCPFCGSKAELHGDCDMVWARCSNYDCKAELITRFDEPEEAIEAWNQRV